MIFRECKERTDRIDKISDLSENISGFIEYIRDWTKLEVDYNTNILLNDMICTLIPLEYKITQIKNKFQYDMHIDKEQINKAIDEIVKELNNIKIVK